MQNIFPTAEKAAIEETIGIKRPSGTVPAEQATKLPNNMAGAPKTNIFTFRPEWFDKETISEWEKNVFKDVENYMEIRNNIIALYENESVELSLSVLTRFDYNLNDSIRVFDFLEEHKIINNETGLSEVLSSLEYMNDEEFNNDVDKSISESKGDFLNEGNNKKVSIRYLKKECLENAVCKCSNKAEYFSSELFFICGICYELRDFPEGYTPRNFHRITDSLLQSIWTKQEEYFLLKNVESYGDDWVKVAEGLNKTPNQCIFHFIKMSILDEIDCFPSMPFVQVPNPISTFIAFVCSMVYPSISTELAKTAIKLLNSPNLMEILIDVAKAKGREVLEMERRKLKKIQKVGLEALMKRAMLKIDAINEMYAEVSAVRTELEDEREKLLEEFVKNS